MYVLYVKPQNRHFSMYIVFEIIQNGNVLFTLRFATN